MTTWNEFADAAPDLAASGLRLIDARGHGEGLLATVRGDAPPRINPISVAIVEGRLFVFVIVGSAKLADLEQDGRYAFHAHQDPEVPHEFQVRGVARAVTDTTLQTAAAAVWPFEVDDSYCLFELDIAHAIIGRRDSADDWPPVYTSWRSAPQGR